MLIDNIKQLRSETIQNNDELLQNVKKCKLAIADILKTHSKYSFGNYSEESVNVAAYVLSVLSIHNYPFAKYNEVQEFVDDEMISYFREYIPEEAWEQLNSLVNNFSNEIFELVPFLPEKYSREFGEFNTPESIIELVNRIVENYDNGHVADICCGKGNFIVSSYIKNSDNNYFGLDTKTRAVAIAKIRAKLLGNNIEIRQGNAFDIDENRYDIVFSNFPFSSSVNSLGSSRNLFEQFSLNASRYLGKPLNVSKADWAFVLAGLERINQDGIGLFIISNGALVWNSKADIAIKKFLIDYNLIEAIICLPKELYDYASIQTSLLVLNKAKTTDEIRIIDASKLYKKGRRLNYLSNDDIEEIAHLYNNDSEISKLVNPDEIVANDYNLLPTRYSNDSVFYENGVEFGSLIKSITRGAPLSAADLDKLNSEEETNYQYLMLANINSGIIDNELPYIKSIDEKYEKFCINNNNLLMSKNGAPFKVAVATVQNGKKILANGNLFIIEVDEDKVNPHYLKAFFSSYEGEKLLSSIASLGTIPSIALSDLKKLVIPLPPMAEQDKIATEFLILEDEIKILENKIKKAKEELRLVVFKGKE